MTEAGQPRDDPAVTRVAALRRTLDARAAGLWHVQADRLVQVAFVTAPDLPAEVARAFDAATRVVPLDRADLGIVAAARTADVIVSIADRLPAGSGSGHWLRAFGARRSVAVPLLDSDGSVRSVLSVALGDSPLDDPAVADIIRRHE